MVPYMKMHVHRLPSRAWMAIATWTVGSRHNRLIAIAVDIIYYRYTGGPPGGPPAATPPALMSCNTRNTNRARSVSNAVAHILY